MAVEQEMAEIYPPDAEALSLLLPDIDCGGCGFASCIEFAEQLMEGIATPDRCTELDEPLRRLFTTVLTLDTSPIPYNIMMEQVPCEVVGINAPDETSPVLVTCNFRETVRILQSILEATQSRCWLLPTFTHGYSVDNAVHERLFKAMAVWKSLKENEMEQKTTHRTLVLPGLAESEKNAIRQLTRWNVTVGPVSGFLTPLFILRNPELV